MARIRTVKPEFWSDEKIVQLPFHARLVFIGLWNFADDDGRLRDEPDRLRMQIMPSDNIDMEMALDVLFAASLVEKWIAPDGSRVLQIPGFARHQVISHKSKSRLQLDQYKKAAVPTAARRQVAQKYGCEPGADSHPVECYFCGAPGSIFWPRRQDGKPSYWVAFSGVELDHFTPEHSGGTTDGNNLILSCRYCNRSRGTNDAHEHFLKSSGALQNNPARREGKRNRREEDNSGSSESGTSPARVRAHEAGSPPEAASKPQPDLSPEPRQKAPPDKPAWNSRENFRRVEERLRPLVPDDWLNDPVVGPLVKLEAGGVDLENEIVPVVLDLVAARQKPIRTWKMLAEVVAERVAESRAGPSAASLPPATEMIELGGHGTYGVGVLRKFIAKWRDNPASWPEHLLGPAPGHERCRVPGRLLIHEAA